MKRIALGLFFLISLRLLAIFWIPPISDEVIQLYMARDIAHLSNFPVYFYGQNYMGPLESYIIAPFFRWFGFSLTGGRICYEFFFISHLAMFVGIVRRLFDRELAVDVFFFLCLLPFPTLFFTSIVGFGEILTLAVLSLLLLLKIADGLYPKSYSLLLGWVSGLAFWCNPIFVVWLIPLGISLGWLVPQGWKKKIPLFFAAGFLAGLFPIWVYGLQTGTWLTLTTAGNRFVKPEEVPNLAYLFLARLRYFFGTFNLEGESWATRKIIGYLSLIPFTFFAFSFYRLISSFFRTAPSQSVQRKIFHLFVITPPFILAALYLSRNLTADEGVRYFLPFMITFIFVVPWGIRQIQSAFGRGLVFFSLTGVFLMTNLISLRSAYRQRQGYLAILQFLEKKNLHYGIADLHLAYALNALGKDRVVASPSFVEARYKPLWPVVVEKGAQFFIFEHTGYPYRRKLDADPQIIRYFLADRDIFYGPSKLLQEIAETKEPIWTENQV